MKVRCIGNLLSDEQRILLGFGTRSLPSYQLAIGSEYLVLGISFVLPHEPHGGGVQFEILNDYGNCRAIPSCLLEIIDDRCSTYWVAKQFADGATVLWPQEFLTEFFHDDLSEGLPNAMSTFSRVVDKLRAEFD